MLTLMFVFLLYRLLFIAQNAPDLLGSLIVTGIFAHIALQAMLNIMVVLNVIPTTGVTLPFVSYGGNSRGISNVRDYAGLVRFQADSL